MGRCSHWLAKQAEEEREHALDMAAYVIKRGGEAKVSMIDVVPEGWGSYAEVFDNVYKHECHVSELIDKLVDVASAERDKATQDFLWGYVREQVEEEGYRCRHSGENQEGRRCRSVLCRCRTR